MCLAPSQAGAGSRKGEIWAVGTISTFHTYREPGNGVSPGPESVITRDSLQL
jgi:hypothetical protein